MHKDKKSLAETHPELAKQWHPTKNGDLSPNDVKSGSHKKVWWKCDKGDDHEWESKIANRVYNQQGCSVCSGRTVVKSNCLNTTGPEIAKQWHPSKNGDLTPYDVTAGSGKRVWWKCNKGDDHEWESKIANRTVNEQGCPFCSGNSVSKTNSLETRLTSQLKKEWHPTKNINVTPQNLTYGSNKEVWWKCGKNEMHDYQMSPKSKLRGRGCPFCTGHKVHKTTSLKYKYPTVAKQWHPTKNGKLTADNVSVGSNKMVWWKCDKGDDHEWEAAVATVVRGVGCSVCAGYTVVKSNCLNTTGPEIAKQWHPSKNGDLTPFDVTAGSNKKVWWKCDKGDDHEWRANINNRVKQKTCPICINQKTVISNCLQTTHPKIAKQWHPSKNGDLTPYDVTAGSGKRVWWKCNKGDDHEWKASVGERSSGNGCPVCSNQKTVISNCLQTTHPKIANQWHPSKNGDLTSFDLTAGSNKKVWWKCDKGDDHEWRTNPVSRTSNKTNCPFCTLTPQSKQELTITFELMKLFKNIDPKGLKTKLEGRLRAIDIFIPKLNLCIEFDGSYWHKDKRDIDKIKSEMLLEEGFKLIRVREEPLKKLYNTDVISKKPYNGKQVTNDIISIILSIFELDTKLVSKIKAYQSKEGLQNEKGLEKYIDKILTEKAEKK
ncbi:zinc-ribbon domain-containing protein [uncultured Polaribacter sp.]|uniref:zinc-ribbon domain-containing protein n=1 Tax=uncultured Polaribacter sp. TaxID=174711 RepID=UPI00260C53D0|nr:zinc-ribbon domain-containing protein [uncultured Polaribacter sp.]